MPSTPLRQFGAFFRPHRDAAMPSTKWDLSRSERKLEELAGVLAGAGRQRLLILTHNNPDPDTIASAFAFEFLLRKRFGVKPVIGYGGLVTRAENKAMVQRLRIRMTPMKKPNLAKYFGAALIDAQPGAGNNPVENRTEPPLIIIDHHPLRRLTLNSRYYDVRTTYGATSTIVAEYIAAAGITPTRSVANALMLGIKTDTNSLVRATAKEDFYAFNYLSPLSNPRMLGLIEKPSLPVSYFRDYYSGLTRTVIYRDVAVSNLGPIQSESIIPELADILLRIEGVRWSLCLGTIGEAMVLSIRSTSRKYGAGNVIRKVVGAAGSAGGHKQMAGGQAPVRGMTQQEVDECAQTLIDKFLKLIDRERVNPKPLVGL